MCKAFFWWGASPWPCSGLTQLKSHFSPRSLKPNSTPHSGPTEWNGNLTRTISDHQRRWSQVRAGFVLCHSSTKELARSVFTPLHVTRLRFVCRSRSMPDLNYTLNGIVKEGKKAADSTNRNLTSISLVANWNSTCDCHPGPGYISQFASSSEFIHKMSVLARTITRRSIAHLISFYYDSLFVVFVAFVCLFVCLFVGCVCCVS